MNQKLSLDETREIAANLSRKQWNRYFFIIPDGKETFRVDRYFDSEAKECYLRGEKFNCD